MYVIALPLERNAGRISLAADAIREPSPARAEQIIVRSFLRERVPVVLARTDATFPDREAAPLVSSDIWIEGQHRAAPPRQAAPFDLRANPAICLKTRLGTTRFYISQCSLDELAHDWGLRRIGGPLAASFDGHDETLYGLAQSLEAVMVEQGRTLFADYAALAFHVHVIRTYGRHAETGTEITGGLAPWQLRRACEFIEANLDGDPSITELAGQCRLSPSHFARAFRRSTGTPPHRWLTARRIQRAKELLQGTSMELAEIALACGFVDQSHMTRAFGLSEGQSPGRWRRLRSRA